MKLKIILLFSILLLITGCSMSSKKVNIPTKQTKTNIIKQQSVMKPKTINADNTPNWILNPNKQSYICSVGSSKLSNDKKTMKKIASMKAKANISKQIKIYIDAKSKATKNSNGKSTYTTSSTQQSTNMLRDVKVVDNYLDETNKRYYIRACSKI